MPNSQTVAERLYRFESIFRSQARMAGLLSREGKVVELNDKATRLFESPNSAEFWEQTFLGQENEALQQALEGGTARFEVEIPTAQATLWLEFFLQPFRGEDGQVAGVIFEAQDVSINRQLRQSLTLQEQTFRSAFEHAPIGMAMVDPQGKWLRVNQSLCRLVGYSEEELLAIDFQTITHPDDLSSDLSLMYEVLDGKRLTYQMEKRYFHKLGQVLFIDLFVSLVRDEKDGPLYFISQIQDVTARKRAEEEIRASLREKELMLQEIHHRVKNNLQLVSSLLSLQAGQIEDSKALKLFRESQGRIRSMALIHDRLYCAHRLDEVDFGDYVSGLARDLYPTYQVSNNDIQFRLAVEMKHLPIDLAIPCGLIANELLSNCLKHAFRSKHSGYILVSGRNLDDMAEIVVEDDGDGFPCSYNPVESESFGLNLVYTLIKQLKGTLTFQSSPTRFCIRFPTPGAR